MLLLYRFSLFLYSLGIKLVAFTNPKANLFLEGRKTLFEDLKFATNTFKKPIWIHAASLGEFEQGRPIIEKLKEQHPSQKIVLSFFSPSGYEIRKNYPLVDYVCYLPMDNQRNANRFIEIIDPAMAIFIKYEFWYYYLKQLKHKNIPVLMVSSIFRDNQVYFHWSGEFFRKVLKTADHFFVQDEPSLKLITTITSNASVSGDTRFDRVLQIAKDHKIIPKVENFLSTQKKCIVIGSSWETDLKFLMPFINKYASQLKFIIAPHNIQEENFEFIESNFDSVTRYSTYEQGKDSDKNILVIDNMGMLSSLYHYADFAYVGGAFRGTLHNTLEAAVYGLPIFIGEHVNNQKFREATGLKETGSLFEYYQIEMLENKYLELVNNSVLYDEICQQSKSYVLENSGATDIIINYINKL